MACNVTVGLIGVFWVQVGIWNIGSLRAIEASL